MTNKELQTLVNTAQSGKLNPATQVWDRLEVRLEYQNKDQKIKKLTLQKKLLAVASCILIVTVAFISLSTEKSSNMDFENNSLAQATQSPSTLYDIHNVRKLNHSYN